MEFEGLITKKQASELLGISLVTMWRWIQDGRIPVYRLGRTLIIKKSDLRGLTKSKVGRKRLKAKVAGTRRRRAKQTSPVTLSGRDSSER